MSRYTFYTPSRIRWKVWGKVVLAASAGRLRSPQKDGLAVLQGIKPDVTVNGAADLPASGPYIVASNHLNGPGIWVGLAAALIASVIGDRTPSAVIRGVGVAAYRDFKILGIPVPPGLTEWVFGRFYGVYEIIRMPHVSEGANARSGAVRRILGTLKQGHVVILFPEGRNVETFVMRSLQPGVGDLIRLAAKAGVPTIPAAVAPAGDSFSVTFSRPLILPVPAGRVEVEIALGRAIASLLPDRYRGAYSEEALSP